MKIVLLKVLFLIGISLPIMQPICAELNAEQIALVNKILNDSQALELLNQTIKTVQDVTTRSCYNNVCASYKGFAQGFNGFGIGLSRLILDCSQKFSSLGQAAADHYWIFGGILIGSAFFYKYILPNIKISVEYKNGHGPAPAPYPAPMPFRPR